jgi:undecaprenyl-diphosphatase
MTLLEAIIIAIVEGLTEFLPISSTGHMIIASTLLGLEPDDFTKMFEVCIQLGAILAVVVLYWRKFFDFSRPLFYAKLLVGVLPALLLGYLFADHIDQLLERVEVVGLMLLIGGIILLFVDRWFKNPSIQSEEDLSFLSALKIGFYQCLAMMPGVSRSAASIIGGMQQKMSRQAAAEFSFFLAVPTMTAVTGYKLLHSHELITQSPENLKLFIVGNVVAFIVAMIAIKFFIDFLKRFGFKMWGYYRIIVGSIILACYFLGIQMEI